MSSVACTLPLPPAFRAADFLEFHRRDPQALAESATTDRLHKGLVWNGQPACLSVRFEARQAVAELAVDGPLTGADGEALKQLVRRLLGLNQRIEEFEQTYAGYPHLGPMLARQAGLRVPLVATPFEALTWGITGQQISVRAAIAVRRQLIKAVGLVHSGGLACYPDAARLAALTADDLRAAGFSATKAQTLMAVSASVLSGELPLDAWLEDLPVDLLRERLLAIRGIGPWTVNYTLLRGFGHLDGSLHGDVAVRHGIQILLDNPDKISEAAAQRWLAEFSPWRALLAAHLWAMRKLAA